MKERVIVLNVVPVKQKCPYELPIIDMLKKVVDTLEK